MQKEIGEKNLKRWWLSAFILALVCALGCSEFREVIDHSSPQSNAGISKSSKKVKEKKVEKKAKKTQQTKQEDPQEESINPLQEEPVEAKQVKKSTYIWPVQGIVTSLFGKRGKRQHDGIDIVAPKGTPIFATADGEVIFSGPMRGYGTLIILKHKKNMFSAYGHMSTILVKKDEKVKQGDEIGKVGRTGNSTDYLLHFEFRKETTAIDPLTYLPEDGRPVRERKESLD